MRSLLLVIAACIVCLRAAAAERDYVAEARAVADKLKQTEEAQRDYMDVYAKCADLVQAAKQDEKLPAAKKAEIETAVQAIRDSVAAERKSKAPAQTTGPESAKEESLASAKAVPASQILAALPTPIQFNNDVHREVWIKEQSKGLYGKPIYFQATIRDVKANEDGLRMCQVRLVSPQNDSGCVAPGIYCAGVSIDEASGATLKKGQNVKVEAVIHRCDLTTITRTNKTERWKIIVHDARIVK